VTVASLHFENICYHYMTASIKRSNERRLYRGWSIQYYPFLPR